MISNGPAGRMVFPKWHLSLKGLIWGFSLSVLWLEEKAEPTLKPTPSLFLGEPLGAGAVQSLPASITLRVGGRWVLQPPSHQAAQGQGAPGVLSSLSPVWVALGDAAPLLLPSGTCAVANALLLFAGLRCTQLAESCLNGGKCETFLNGTEVCQ